MKKVLFILPFMLIFCLIAPARGEQYEPPINIVFIVHFEPLGYAQVSYDQCKVQLAWLQSLTASYDPPVELTILVNGDVAEWAVGMDPTGPAFFNSLEADGHEIGGHAHNIVRSSEYT